MLRLLIKTIFLMSAIFNWALLSYAAESNSTIVYTPSWWDQADYDKKVLAVKSVIDHFKQDGISIRKDPEFYVSELDSDRSEDPKAFVVPIGVHLKTLFIMYRDFDNGENPDQLIREVLGEEEYDRYIEENSEMSLELNYQEWLKEKSLTK